MSIRSFAIDMRDVWRERHHPAARAVIRAAFSQTLWFLWFPSLTLLNLEGAICTPGLVAGFSAVCAFLCAAAFIGTLRRGDHDHLLMSFGYSPARARFFNSKEA